MNFILLPSHRVAMVKSLGNTLGIAPFKAEELVLNPDSKKKQSFVALIEKTLNLYSIQNLEKPLISTTFSKKINSVSFHPFSEKSTALVSDKFGDIYSVDSENPTYLNSNLGIPSFLHCYEDYLILADEMCKIKIYNIKEMHELFAIWYIVNSQPLNLIKLNKDNLILLSRYQDKEKLESREDIFSVKTKDLKNAEFPGSKIYEGQLTKLDLIKDSMILPMSQKSFVYLAIKKNEVDMKVFSLTQNGSDFKQTKSFNFNLGQSKFDLEYLNATYDSEGKRLFISLGKEVDYHQDIMEKIPQLQKGKQSEVIDLNQFEKVIVYYF